MKTNWITPEITELQLEQIREYVELDLACAGSTHEVGQYDHR